ncbi:FlgO family outer membrane protein [Pseudoalteromonas mariniglutinosa]|uniref:FlgO family outer membrane protein n=1 Tax=Pseudoalteromonas mariniglutinosa TaxID=206042 RepID=UPI00384D2984
MRLILILFLLTLAACSVTEQPKPNASTVAPNAAMAPFTVDQYVASLSTQLSQINGPYKNNARIAVTSFYFADALDTGLAQGQAAGLSQQIQESLMTQFTQLGYHIIEYRLENTLNLTSTADAILSRDISKLRQRQNIDFVLTGTLTRQQHAYIINARLVSVQDQRIVSAANTELPINVMWGNEKIQQRSGQLYRSEY